jgi:hypothetical protein
MSSPVVWLSDGRSLRGTDTLPVLSRFKSLDIATLGQSPEAFASVSKKHLLHSYSKEDLNREAKGLMGHDLSVSSTSILWLLWLLWLCVV